MNAKSGSPRFAVIYDGECGVCRKLVARLREWDRENSLEISPSQAAGIPSRFPWIPPGAFQESVQIIRLSDGKTWAGGAALEELLRVLPRGRLVGCLFRIPPMRGVIDRLYRWFARNRYRLGCGDHCRAG